MKHDCKRNDLQDIYVNYHFVLRGRENVCDSKLKPMILYRNTYDAKQNKKSLVTAKNVLRYQSYFEDPKPEIPIFQNVNKNPTSLTKQIDEKYSLEYFMKNHSKKLNLQTIHTNHFSVLRFVALLKGRVANKGVILVQQENVRSIEIYERN